ncbi:MAG TPA: hypothetical protein VMC41_04375 [Candidatus Nanoarchaeia archaeon]|nr:hypothetical protein [Candidatus Nanoarchaeia archaeon]
MKKYFRLTIIAVFFCSWLIPFLPARAANLSNAFDTNTISAAAGNTASAGTNVYQIIGTIIQTLLGLLGVIFILLLVYGGVTWMTSEGDEAKVEKAQRIIRSAIIGLIVVIAAFAISVFAISVLNKAVIGK